MTEPDSGPPGEDDATVKPPAKTTSSGEALKNVTGPVSDVFGAGIPGGDGTIGPTTASGFLSFYPLLRLFRAVAMFQKPRDQLPEKHVAELRKEHPKFYGICVFVDFMLVFIASSMLLTAAGFALYKTFVK